MKELLLVFLLTPFWALSQENLKRSFDKFDSIYTVKSDGGSIGALKLVQPYADEIIYFSIEKYAMVKNGKVDSTWINCYATFISPNTIVSDKDCGIKVMFEDGQVKDYKNESNREVYAEGRACTFYFRLAGGDPMSMNSIKGVKAYFNGGSITVDASERNCNTIKKMIQLVESDKMDFTSL